MHGTCSDFSQQSHPLSKVKCNSAAPIIHFVECSLSLWEMSFSLCANLLPSYRPLVLFSWRWLDVLQRTDGLLHWERYEYVPHCPNPNPNPCFWWFIIQRIYFNGWRRRLRSERIRELLCWRSCRVVQCCFWIVHTIVSPLEWAASIRNNYDAISLLGRNHAFAPSMRDHPLFVMSYSSRYLVLYCLCDTVKLTKWAWVFHGNFLPSLRKFYLILIYVWLLLN